MEKKDSAITRMLLLALIVSLLPTFFVLPAIGGTSNFQLFGSASQGWGLTSGNITSPGPTLTVSQGDLVNLTLTSQDGLAHIFLVDYNGNGIADPGEPESPSFSSTINFQFIASVAGLFNYYCVFHPGIMFGKFAVRATHDVAVTAVKPSKTTAGAGPSIQVNVTVVNFGGFNETFNATLYRLGATRLFDLNGSASAGWNNTIPGPNITVNQFDTVVLTLVGIDALPHEFFVDYNGNVAPDLGEPTSLAFQSTTIKYIFTADKAGIFNYHCAFHPATMVGNFTVAPPSNSTIGSQQLAPPLAVNETRTLTFAWNTTGVAIGGYTLLVVADIVPSDINATNNNFADSRVTVIGDINGDFTVNILDAITMGNAFLTTPSSSNWNPNSDLNSDNVVNLLDAIVMGNHFNQSSL